jgi:hypothetical protein
MTRLCYVRYRTHVVQAREEKREERGERREEQRKMRRYVEISTHTTREKSIHLVQASSSEAGRVPDRKTSPTQESSATAWCEDVHGCRYLLGGGQRRSIIIHNNSNLSMGRSQIFSGGGGWPGEVMMPSYWLQRKSQVLASNCIVP